MIFRTLRLRFWLWLYRRLRISDIEDTLERQSATLDSIIDDLTDLKDHTNDVRRELSLPAEPISKKDLIGHDPWLGRG